MLKRFALRCLGLLSALAFAVGVTGLAEAAKAPKTAKAAAPKKVALVVGVQDYDVTKLKLANARKDAVEVGKTLRDIGFTVHLVTDPTRADLGKVLAAFEADLEGADVGMFFYSGHGMQTVRAGSVEASNLLLPKDFRIPEATGREREMQVEASTVSLEDILKHMRNKARVGIVFLDACRDNPFAEEEIRVSQASTEGTTAARRVSVTRGLSRTEVPGVPGAANSSKTKAAARSSPTGMVIAYATAPGEVAEDGVGEHSPFTRALLKHIKTPKRTIEQVLRDVATDVHSSTDGLQRPWISASLLGGDLYLVPPISGVTQPIVPGSVGLPASPRATDTRPAPARAAGKSQPVRAAAPSRQQRAGGSVARSSGGRGGSSLPPGLGVGVGAGL